MALDKQKDLHLIYTSSVEDIRFAKSQQWRLTYYALILMVALMYLKTKYPLCFSWDDVLINSLIPLIAGVAITFLWKMEGDIRRYRGRIKGVRAFLTGPFKNIIKLEANYLERGYKSGYVAIMSGTLVGAALLLMFVPPSIRWPF